MTSRTAARKVDTRQLTLFAWESPAARPVDVVAPLQLAPPLGEPGHDVFMDFLDEVATLTPDEGQVSRTHQFQARVTSGAGAPVRVIITDNRHSLLSWRMEQGHHGAYVIRAHHMFLDAPEDVALAVGRWMVGQKKAEHEALIDRYMGAHRHLVTRDRRPLGPARGRFHDLHTMFHHLNATEFSEKVTAAIGWGDPGAPRRRRRTTIQLGCYDPEARAIVIHPALDQAFVPGFFVQSVVFHEMLHQVLPATHGNARRCVHGPEFRAREEAFHLTPQALLWQKDNLGKLLGFRRRPVAASNRRARR
jgi:hypothetical protein